MPREDKILVRKISSLECFMFILGSDRRRAIIGKKSLEIFIC